MVIIVKSLWLFCIDGVATFAFARLVTFPYYLLNVELYVSILNGVIKYCVDRVFIFIFFIE